KVSYIEVALEDIEVANRLAHQVLGRSLDELPPQTRRLLGALDELVSAACPKLAMDRADYRFTRREVREATGWGATQTRIHLDRLVELEYVAVHRGGRGQGFVYELCYDGQGKDGRPFLVGLAPVESLADVATAKSWRGQKGDLAGGSRPDDGPVAATSRDGETVAADAQTGSNQRNGHAALAAAHLGQAEPSASYAEVARAAARAN